MRSRKSGSSTGSPFQMGASPVSVWPALIVATDDTQYTATVQTDPPNSRIFNNLPYAVPFADPRYGGGIDFGPTIGSRCWVMQPSDSSAPFILGWSPCQGDDPSNVATFGYRNRRPKRAPGDIVLSNLTGGGGVFLRADGVIEVRSTALARVFYIPLRNMIQTICENYGVETLAGGVSWVVCRDEQSPIDKATYVATAAKQFASDKKAILQVRAGSVDCFGGNVSDAKATSTLFSFTMYSDGSDAQKKTVEMKVTAAGDVSFDVKEESLSISVKKVLHLAVGASIIFDAIAETGVVEASADEFRFLAPIVVLGDGDTEPVALGDAVVDWLSSHTHSVSTKGTASAQTGTADPSELPTTGLKSSKVRVAK